MSPRAPTSDTLEAAIVQRALAEGRPLAGALGITHDCLVAARALARWAQAIGEHGLALAAWDGCAALDDTCSSWLGLAEVSLELGLLERAWSAAAGVTVRTDASRRERAHAHAVLARLCLALERPEQAHAHLEIAREEAPEPLRSWVASALETLAASRAI